MKTETLIFALLLAGVCVADKKFELSGTQSAYTENVKLTDQFAISFNSNPTTGFRWELTSSSLANLELASSDKYGEFVASARSALGAGGKQVYSFRTVHAGSEALEFVYRRPWTEEQAKKVVVTINILP